MAYSVGYSQEQKPKEWPVIRDDLSLLQGPRAYDGSPTWTLYDPAVHRYFRIGWLEFECLHRWHLGNSEDIAEAIQNETPIDVEAKDVDKFLEFVEQNNLVKPKGRESTLKFLQFTFLTKQGFWTWLLHNYLFLRIPLVKPQRFLKQALPLVNIFFHRRFIFLLIAAIGLALFLVSQQWSAFTHSFMYSFTPEGILATLGMMSLSKVVHELGHAFAASHFGCRVPAMGLALNVVVVPAGAPATDSASGAENPRIDALRSA